jgi:phenylpropionate dioxygenase-like ring-hydroxylating dioxygenase large terminal subunit
MSQHETVLPRGCTFSESDWRVLANYWYPVAVASEVAAKPVAVTLLDQRIVLYRTASKGVVAANDLCLHRGVPLSMGFMDSGDIVCAYHGLRYNAEGHCVCVPSNTEGPISPRLRLRMFLATERYGLIWVCLSGQPANVLPVIPEWDDPTYQTAVAPPIDMNASAGRQLEGFLDVAHFAWVHHETFGDRNNPYVPTYSVDETEHGFHMEYRSTVGNYMRQDGSELEPEKGVLRIFDGYLPFSARLTVHLPDGARLVILDSASPISARRTRLFAPLLRNYDLDTPLQPFIDYNVKIFNEDLAIAQAQYPEDLPLDLADEIHIRADKTSIVYRRLLSKLGLGRSFTS